MRGTLRPTPAGVSLAAAAIGSALLGWGLGYGAFRLLAIGTAVALAVSALIARRVPDLDLEREITPRRVERGRPANAVTMIVNRRVRVAAPTTLTTTVGRRRVDRHVAELVEGRSVVVSAPLPTRRRGSIEIGPMELTRHDPAGLWRCTRLHGRPATLVVHPRIHPIDPRPGGRLRHLDGSGNDQAQGGSITFQSLREYVRGDDIRQVHWRSSARTGTLMVREHVDTSLPSMIVVLDTSAGPYDDPVDFESAVDVASSLVQASQRAGHLARLITTCGATMTVRVGQRGNDVADFLASVAVTDDAQLAVAADGVRRGRERDAIVIVSGDLCVGGDDDSASIVTAMTRGFTTPVLATVRPDRADAAIWPGGLHLSGADAERLLARWGVSGRAAAGRVPARTAGRS